MLSLYLSLIETETEKRKFMALYEEYKNLMFYVANGILNDTHLSEDAVQEAFLRIAKNFHKVDEIICPQTKAFVVIITRNISITILNREKRISDIHDIIAESANNVSDEIFSEVSYKFLSECILQLPEIYRDVLYLNHIYGYNFKEIANLLSISVDTAKKRAQRARILLKRLIENEEQNNE